MKYLSGNMKTFGKILMVMYGITALLLFLLAFLLQKFQFGEQMTEIGIMGVYVIVCFLGGYMSGKVLMNRKFLWGMLMGIFYVLVMLGITMIVRGSQGLSLSGILLNILLCLGSGMLGGMIS